MEKRSSLINKIAAAALAFGMICATPALPDGVFGLRSVNSYAEIVDSGKCGDNLTWTLDDEGTLTISGNGDMYSYDTNMNWSPFANGQMNNRIKKVIIEPGVTSIGDFAFQKCRILTSVSLPDSISSIGEYAFYDCYKLNDLALPDELKSISRGLFCDCHSLERIDIPKSVTSIGNSAFVWCKSLKTINIPKSVTKMDYDIFRWSGVTDIYYAGTEEEWNNIDFNNLFSGRIQYSTIEEYLVISEDVTIHFLGQSEIVATGQCGDNLYWTLDSNGKLTITGTGKMYDYQNTGNTNPFRNLDVKSAVIENGAENIGTHAFSGCGNMTDIQIPDSVKSIGNYAFCWCRALNEIKNGSGIISIGEQPFLYCGFSDLVIPENVSTIERYAYTHCDSLKTVTIPKSITKLSYKLFASSNSRGDEYSNTITDVYFQGTESEWEAIDYSDLVYKDLSDGKTYRAKTIKQYLGLRETVELHFSGGGETAIYPITGGGISVSATAVDPGDEFELLIHVPAIAQKADSLNIRAEFDANAFEVVSWSQPISGAFSNYGDGYFMLQAVDSTPSIDLSEGVTIKAKMKVKSSASAGSYSFTLSRHLIAYIDENGIDVIEMWTPAVTQSTVAVTEKTVPDIVSGGGISISKSSVAAGEQFEVTVTVPKIQQNADSMNLRVNFDANAFEVVSWSQPISGALSNYGDGFFVAVASFTQRNIDLSNGLKFTAKLRARPGAALSSYRFSLVSSSLSYVEDYGDTVELWAPLNTAGIVSVKSDANRDIVSGGGISVSPETLGAGETFELNVNIPALKDDSDTASIEVVFDPDVFEVVTSFDNSSFPGSICNSGSGFIRLSAINVYKSIKTTRPITLTAEMKVKKGIRKGSYAITLNRYSISAVSEETYDGIELWEPEKKTAYVKVTDNVIKGKVTAYGSLLKNAKIELLDNGVVIESCTATDGTYSLSNFTVGDTYTLRAFVSGHAVRSYTVSPGAEPVVLDVQLLLIGDVNGDGEIDAKDATQILRYDVGLASMLKDANGNENEYVIAVACIISTTGVPSAKDATQILRYTAGLPSKLSVL